MNNNINIPFNLLSYGWNCTCAQFNIIIQVSESADSYNWNWFILKQSNSRFQATQGALHLKKCIWSTKSMKNP